MKLLQVGFPSPQWAPLYSIWYFLLNAVLPAGGNIQLYYASFILLSTAIPLMIYGYLRRVAVTPIVALLGALFFLVSYSNLNIRPYPAKFAQFWVLIFLLASTFVPRRWHAMLLLIALLTLGFIRPEYALSFVLSVVLAVVIVLIKVWKQGLGALKGIWLQSLLVAGLAVTLVMVLGNPLAGGRNLVAFKQHVALNYTATSDGDTNPWGNEDVIAKQLFGDFTSIPQAARNNPQAFIRHLWINARTYPVNLAQTLIRSLPAATSGAARDYGRRVCAGHRGLRRTSRPLHPPQPAIPVRPAGTRRLGHLRPKTAGPAGSGQQEPDRAGCRSIGARFSTRVGVLLAIPSQIPLPSGARAAG